MQNRTLRKIYRELCKYGGSISAQTGVQVDLDRSLDFEDTPLLTIRKYLAWHRLLDTFNETDIRELDAKDAGQTLMAPDIVLEGLAAMRLYDY